LSDGAVRKATGKSKNEWFGFIETAGFGDKSHKEIAVYLETEAGLDGWWAQEITVLYERKTGRRVKGQTADGLYQIGVSKTLDRPLADIWTLLLTPEALALFVGEEPAGDPSAGLEDIAGTGGDGTEYAMTTFVPSSHFRMRWRSDEWEAPSILQLRLTEKGPAKTGITVHHEKLPSADAREAMRARWKEALKNLREMIE
jgi:uncharacterized protein YndB with AHSA1/START domain